MKITFVRILSTLLPNYIANLAYKQLTSPQIKKLRPNELLVLDKSQKEILRFQDFDIQLYTWLGGQDTVMLIHGWEGQAGNFSDLIQKLLEENYTVYAFDAPSHGFSSKGKTSLIEFTELVGILIRKFEVSKLVSHSFGGAATTYALLNNLDLKISKYVLLTTPDKFSEQIEDISEQVGITAKVKNILINRLENETSLSVNNLNVSDFVKNINVDKALIIHDKKDTVIPISRSRNVHNHWKVSEFFEVEGTGHFRILRTKHVLEKTLEFLNA